MVGVGVGVGVGVEWPAASASRLGRYQTAAVSSEDGGCSRIGRRALADGGSAVDAAVAVLFCIGVVHSQAAGIGGGSVFTVYEAAAGRARVLDARETAPQAATEDMFGGNITAALIGFSLFPFGSLSLFSTSGQSRLDPRPIRFNDQLLETISMFASILCGCNPESIERSIEKINKHERDIEGGVGS